MKTNVSIDLDDDQRRILANIIDGKTSRRMITRAEVKEFTLGQFAALLSGPTPSTPENVYIKAGGYAALAQVAPEDRETLAGKSVSYIIGHNKVKQRFNNQSDDRATNQRG
jgi:hypothetical protein